MGRVDKLAAIYYDVQHPAGFASQKKLAKAANVSLEKAKTWLKGEETYALHKPIKRKFDRLRYVVSNERVCFETDLAEMQNVSSQNDGYRYIVCVIDIFSKKAWGEAVKDKKSATVAKALKLIFDRSGFPLKLRSDRGKEYIGSEVQKMLKENNVKHIVTNNIETKCAICERFIRTLKEKIYKYFTRFGVQKYVHILQQLFTAYNNTEHSAIGRAPNEVNSHNIKEVWDYLYSGDGRYPKLKVEFQPKSVFKIGDYVKVSAAKHKLTKGYLPNWTNEVFKIVKIIQHKPVVYKLADWEGEKVDGVWYAEELQLVDVTQKTKFRIDKILGSRGRGANKQLFVSWAGYPEKFNSYILEKDLIAL